MIKTQTNEFQGWEVDPLVRPKAARFVVTRAFCEEGVLELFVRDVASAVIQLVNGQAAKKGRLSMLYTTLGSVSPPLCTKYGSCPFRYTARPGQLPLFPFPRSI